MMLRLALGPNIPGNRYGFVRNSMIIRPRLLKLPARAGKSLTKAESYNPTTMKRLVLLADYASIALLVKHALYQGPALTYGNATSIPDLPRTLITIT
jgi:hypothetical protein